MSCRSFPRSLWIPASFGLWGSERAFFLAFGVLGLSLGKVKCPRMNAPRVPSTTDGQAIVENTRSGLPLSGTVSHRCPLCLGPCGPRSNPHEHLFMGCPPLLHHFCTPSRPLTLVFDSGLALGETHWTYKLTGETQKSNWIVAKLHFFFFWVGKQQNAKKKISNWESSKPKLPGMFAMVFLTYPEVSGKPIKYSFKWNLKDIENTGIFSERIIMRCLK